MAVNRIVLGDVVFEGLDLPEMIEFVPEQTLGRRAVVDQGRVVNAAGLHPQYIKWSGLFCGTDAKSRAKSVEALVQSGAQVSLTLGTHVFRVVVMHFDADYGRAFEIPYKFKCAVIDEAGAGFDKGENTIPHAEAASSRALRALKALARFLGRHAARGPSSSPSSGKGER